MIEPSPATIHVSEEHSGEVPASGAKLFVSVQGSRVFSGNSAMTEAAEVRRLIDALVAAGAGPRDVELVNVHLDVKQGVFSKSSSATYSMRILCPDPTRLTSLLDAIADQKNCTLQRVAWDFGATNERRAEWLALCAQRARAKAAAIATALGHELGGVERIVEERTPEAELRIQTFGDVLPAMARRSASVSEELGGLELSPTRTLTVKLQAYFKLR
jgi:uncharacterized protein YggE